MSTTHLIDSMTDSDGRYQTPVTLVVDGASRGGPGGWKIAGWDESRTGRLVMGGDEIQGPQACLVGLCAVIDNVGGTGAEHARLAERGLLIHAKAGDVLVIGGSEYELTVRGGHADLKSR